MDTLDGESGRRHPDGKQDCQGDQHCQKHATGGGGEPVGPDPGGGQAGQYESDCTSGQNPPGEQPQEEAERDRCEEEPAADEGKHGLGNIWELGGLASVRF